MIPTLEKCPSHLLNGPDDQPQYGGNLFFNSETGLAGCANPECGWSGTPTIVDGIVSTRCPVCEISPKTDYDAKYQAMEHRIFGAMKPLQRRASTVPRNQPCPCESGLKAKKCPCPDYAV